MLVKAMELPVPLMAKMPVLPTPAGAVKSMRSTILFVLGDNCVSQRLKSVLCPYVKVEPAVVDRPKRDHAAFAGRPLFAPTLPQSNALKFCDELLVPSVKWKVNVPTVALVALVEDARMRRFE